MTKFLHIVESLLLTLLMQLACALLLIALVTSPVTMNAATGGKAAEMAQSRIDQQALEIEQRWHITPGLLAELTQNAVNTHRTALSEWWEGLFDSAEYESYPAYLTMEQERQLVSLVMADASFAAENDPELLRAIARDEVAYAVDQAVCRAVLPLRASLADLAANLASQRLPMTMIRPAVLSVSLLCLGASAVLMCALERRAGAAFVAAAGGMALLSVPVMALNLPGMLAELSPIAARQAQQVLRLLGGCWFGAAALTGLLGVVIIRTGKADKVEINHIFITNKRLAKPLTLAVAADLHDGPWESLVPELQRCDAILIPGDLVDRHANTCEEAIRFLQAAPDIAPTFYSLGNHERKFKRLAEYWPHVESSRVTVLDNRAVNFEGVEIGGLSSAAGGPDPSWLPEFAASPHFRLLMCHHPEYFGKIEGFDIDLTISGHAHGGQWRIGRQGVYAPGQGLFPSLTSGWYYNRKLFVSRGVNNAAWMPRLNCPCELVILHLNPADED